MGKATAAKTPARSKPNCKTGKRQEVTLRKGQEEAPRDTTTRDEDTSVSASTLPPKQARKPGGPGRAGGAVTAEGGGVTAVLTSLGDYS